MRQAILFGVVATTLAGVANPSDDFIAFLAKGHCRSDNNAESYPSIGMVAAENTIDGCKSECRGQSPQCVAISYDGTQCYMYGNELSDSLAGWTVTPGNGGTDDVTGTNMVDSATCYKRRSAVSLGERVPRIGLMFHDNEDCTGDSTYEAISKASHSASVSRIAIGTTSNSDITLDMRATGMQGTALKGHVPASLYTLTGKQLSGGDFPPCSGGYILVSSMADCKFASDHLPMPYTDLGNFVNSPAGTMCVYQEIGVNNPSRQVLWTSLTNDNAANQKVCRLNIAHLETDANAFESSIVGVGEISGVRGPYFPQYAIGKLNKNECPDHYTRIATEAQCDDVFSHKVFGDCDGMEFQKPNLIKDNFDDCMQLNFFKADNLGVQIDSDSLQVGTTYTFRIHQCGTRELDEYSGPQIKLLQRYYVQEEGQGMQAKVIERTYEPTNGKTYPVNGIEFTQEYDWESKSNEEFFVQAADSSPFKFSLTEGSFLKHDCTKLNKISNPDRPKGCFVQKFATGTDFLYWFNAQGSTFTTENIRQICEKDDTERTTTLSGDQRSDDFNLTVSISDNNLLTFSNDDGDGLEFAVTPGYRNERETCYKVNVNSQPILGDSLFAQHYFTEWITTSNSLKSIKVVTNENCISRADQSPDTCGTNHVCYNDLCTATEYMPSRVGEGPPGYAFRGLCTYDMNHLALTGNIRVYDQPSFDAAVVRCGEVAFKTKNTRSFSIGFDRPDIGFDFDNSVTCQFFASDKDLKDKVDTYDPLASDPSKLCFAQVPPDPALAQVPPGPAQGGGQAPSAPANAAVAIPPTRASPTDTISTSPSTSVIAGSAVGGCVAVIVAMCAVNRYTSYKVLKTLHVGQIDASPPLRAEELNLL